jgi:DNA-binding NarL/FixJ family response regulator
VREVASNELSIAGLLSNWLDREWEARFLVDERQSLLWSNGAAASWIEEANCALKIQGGLLVAKESKLQCQLASMLASSSRQTSCFLTASASEQQELLFSAREVGHFAGYKCVALAARSITDTNTHQLIGLSDAFNLTPSEEAVLQQMMRGRTVDRIAHNSRTSPETVRTHVRRAYSKMSVSSREEMFSRLKPFLFYR